MTQAPVVGVARQLRTTRIDGSRFAGRVLGQTPFLDTACVVVGVNRDGTIHTDVGSDFRLQQDDEIILVGPDTDIGTVS